MRLKSVLRHGLTTPTKYPIRLLSEQELSSDNNELRAYQPPFIESNSPYSLNVSPVGSGKSVMLLAVAAKRYWEGKTTIILTPKHGVSKSIRKYTDGSDFKFHHNGQEYYLPSGLVTMHKRSSTLLESLSHDYGVFICCYQSLIKIYNKLSPEIKANLLIMVDEAHHSSTGQEQTQLGNLIMQLHEDNVPISMWTATAFRADNAPLIPHHLTDDFIINRRTLVQHFKEGYCPDFNIRLRLYHHVQIKEYSSLVSTGHTIKLGSVEALLLSYVDQFFKDTTQQTLMVLPSQMTNGNKECYTASSVSKQLENMLRAEWSKRGITRPLNLVQLGSSDGVTLASQTVQGRSEFDRLDSPEHIDVVIAINSMDEGVDWPDCSQAFMPRVPNSLVRIMQLSIGRTLRCPKRKDHPHKSWNGQSWGASNVWFFEIGVHMRQEDELTPAIRDLAARIKCLSYGIEFTEPIDSIKLSKKIRRLVNQEKESLRDLGAGLAYKLAQYAIKLVDEGTALKKVVTQIQDWVQPYNVTLSKIASLEYLAEIGVIKPQQLERVLGSERIKQIANQHRLDEDAIIDELSKQLKMSGSVDVLQLLSQKTITPSRMREKLLGHYKTLEEARAAAKAIGITTQRGYQKGHFNDKRLPSHPELTYKHCWKGWKHFLGKEVRDIYPTMEEATAAVKLLGIVTETDYAKKRRQDPRLPANPRQYYRSVWQNWSYFVAGTYTPKPYETIEEIRQAIADLGIITEKQYAHLRHKDPRLPRNPRKHPKFKDWEHLVTGTPRGIYATYAKAQKAAQALGVTSKKEYNERYKEDRNLPRSPDQRYVKDWRGWKQFLGLPGHDKKYTMEEAMKAVRKLGINSVAQYRNYIKSPGSDRRLRCNAPRAYKESWAGWPHYLQNGETSFNATNNVDPFINAKRLNASEHAKR